MIEELFTNPVFLSLFSALLILTGRLIWGIISEARQEAKDRGELVVRNTIETARLDERVDGHEKRIDVLEDGQRTQSGKK